MLYELLGGKFNDGSKGVFVKGSVVESNKDLITAFPNRFRLVSSQVIEKVADRPSIPTPPSSGSADKTGGQALKAVPPVPASPKKGKSISESAGPASPKYGSDETGLFPLARVLKMKVYYNGEKYSVVEVASGVKLNKKRIDTPGKVTEFLKAYLEE